jgi:hypothetical protein
MNTPLHTPSTSGIPERVNGDGPGISGRTLDCRPHTYAELRAAKERTLTSPESVLADQLSLQLNGF